MDAPAPVFCPIVEAGPNPWVQLPTQVVTPEGVSFVNLAKYTQKIFWLAMKDGANALSVTLAALGPGTGSMTPPADQGGQGDVEIHKLYARSTGQFSLRPYLQQNDRYLANQQVESTLMLGYPELPSRLLQPLFLPATNSLQLNLVDLSNAPNTVRIVGEGMTIVDPMGTLGVTAKQMQQYYYRSAHPYWATWDSGSQVTLAANGSSTQTITIPSNADLNGFWIVARATAPTGVNVDIFEGNRRRLTNGTLPLDLIASCTRSVTGMPGNLIPAASLPPVWQFTHLFQRGTQLSITITDTSGSQNVVSLAIVGQLIYDLPSSPGLAVATPQAWNRLPFPGLPMAGQQPGAAMAGLASMGRW